MTAPARAEAIRRTEQVATALITGVISSLFSICLAYFTLWGEVRDNTQAVSENRIEIQTQKLQSVSTEAQIRSDIAALEVEDRKLQTAVHNIDKNLAVVSDWIKREGNKR